MVGILKLEGRRRYPELEAPFGRAPQTHIAILYELNCFTLEGQSRLRPERLESTVPH